ncbi:MAG: hypothetical protein GX639_14515 [Fibrobacter sp.]|nr:hypothetical protein [Fibrobacter sp.]
MSNYNQNEMVAATRIIKDLTTKTPTLQAVFNQDAVNISSELDNLIKETDRLEHSWHAEVADTDPILEESKIVFAKYRDLVIKRLPGAAKMDWQETDVKPDVFALNLEKLIGIIEDNEDKLPFAETALAELVPISNKLDMELTEDREARRIYRNSVLAKNAALKKAEIFFYETRRFIRRDLGRKSPEYSQVKDKAVRKAAKELEQQGNETLTEKQVVTEESINS